MILRGVPPRTKIRKGRRTEGPVHVRGNMTGTVTGIVKEIETRSETENEIGITEMIGIGQIEKSVAKTGQMTVIIAAVENMIGIKLASVAPSF